MAGSSDPEVKELAVKLFDHMLEDLIMDVGIAAHREIKRGRATCGTCGTKCRAHLPLVPPAASSSTLAPPSSQGEGSSRSRTSSPQPSSQSQESRVGGYKTGPEKGTGGSTGIGSGSGRIDASGNAFFDCLVCGRAIASTRYAPHLSSCLGLNGSTRRGTARNAAVKARLGNNDRSSPSPFATSENGDSDADSASSKKIKGNLKRGQSPSKPSSILNKKAKLSSSSPAPASNIARPSLPPSKLGRPPTYGSQSDGRSPSPAPSAVPSIVSSQGTMSTSTTSRKKPPPANTAFDLTMDVDDAGGEEYVPNPNDSDGSSEGPDDY